MKTKLLLILVTMLSLSNCREDKKEDREIPKTDFQIILESLPPHKLDLESIWDENEQSLFDDMVRFIGKEATYAITKMGAYELIMVDQNYLPRDHLVIYDKLHDRLQEIISDNPDKLDALFAYWVDSGKTSKDPEYTEAELIQRFHEIINLGIDRDC